ncbi:Hva22-like protein i [Thalictrum thalictroides]|uniref:HVA22-like protein n=1 Tax=Thalictrum thalictroides TaxID=46969 RepID=A0A7J6VBY0_THATH|nr:Hva22-like protein i [Thalictrum thalictroides]
MMGSFLTRALIMIFGYSYPAYECYKTVEKNKLDIEKLRFWCQYWIIVALLTVFEKFGDTLISWVPMYAEAKLAFFIYLWFPQTKGATYVYNSFLCPYLAKHEKDIDRNLLELRTRAADIIILYGQKAATYGQSRFFEILQYFAAQSTPKPHTAQSTPKPHTAQSTPKPRTAQQGAETPQVPPTVQQQPQQEPSRTSSKSTTQLDDEAIQEVVSPPVPISAIPPQTAVANQPSKEVTSQNEQSEADSEEKEAEAVTPISKCVVNPPPQPQETVMEETIRVTRGRLRKLLSSESH